MLNKLNVFAKARKDLEALSADQLNAKLSAWSEKNARVLTDKNTGTVQTLFNSAALAFKDHISILLDVAAEKNGVKGQSKGFENIMKDIVKATEARGSKSAVKIRAYVELVDQLRAAAPGYDTSTKNPLEIIKKVDAAVKASKQFG